MAYAAEEGIYVKGDGDNLESELASRSGDYPDGAFAFYDEGLTLKEGDGDREVKVVRMGGTSLAATVDVKVMDLTAVYGEDYEVYYKDGLKKVPLTVTDEAAEKAAEEAKAAAEAEAAAEAAKSEDAEVTSSLRAAYSGQTGHETVDTDWRGQSEEYLVSKGATDSANQIINAVDGASNTLSFAEGEYVKSLYIHVKDDDKAESDEAFKMLLGNASAGVLGEQLQLNVQINDNEQDEAIVFGMKDAEVVTEQGATTAQVTIERTSGVDYYAGAVVRTASGSASSETSYDALDGTQVAFTPGETSRTIEVPLKEGAQEGSYFSVMLDSDMVNVDDTRANTVVWVGEKGSEEPVIAAADGEPAAQADEAEDTDTDDEVSVVDEAVTDDAATGEDADAAEDVTEEELAPLDAGEPQARTYAGATPSLASTLSSNAIALAAETKDGVTYDTKGVKIGIVANVACKSNLDQTDRTNGSLNMSGATKMYVATTLTGRTKTWGVKYYKKNGSFYVNGSRKVYHKVTKKNETEKYTDTFDLSYGESQSKSIRIETNTDSLSRYSNYSVSSAKLYYPRYTLTLQDAKQTLKGKNWTSTTDYKEFNVNSIKGSASWGTKTVKVDESTSLVPGTLTQGVSVKEYKVYAGKDEIGTFTSPNIKYSDLNSLRNEHESKIKSAKYKLTIKPVYETASATVKFESQDYTAIAFSGNVSKESGNDDKSGFKVGDTLKCSQIDKVSFTATCPNNQEIQVTDVIHQRAVSKSRAVIETLKPKSDKEKASFSKTVDVDYATEYLKVNHGNASLTFEYTPGEATAENAASGAVVVYNNADRTKKLGETVVGKPLTLTDSLAMLSNTYFAQAVFGDGFLPNPEDVPSSGKISFSTHTVWSYRDPSNGASKSTMGNALMFSPYYANETVNYHFKLEQDDETPAGVKGKVYIDETPLFSKNAKVKSKEAVGVSLNIGGYDTVSNSTGDYSVDAHFNKGEYVAASLKYNTLSLASDVAVSKNTVKDFHINVDTAERLTVDSATMTKRVDTGVYGMDNKQVYESREVESVLREDTDYTFNIQTRANADAVPKSVVFKFYAKDGALKSDKTKTVPVNGQGAASLTLNPSTENLAVGDSMTVTLVDAKGTEYFEHQTTVILGQKLEGMYTFNFKGSVATDKDNPFVKVLGGLANVYDFALDTVSANAGTYTDADGAQHQLMFIGFGNGFSNKGNNAYKEVYETLQENIAAIDRVNAGDIEVDANDSIQIFGNGAWGLDVSLGIIMDSQMQTEGDRKGEYTFNDYLMVANVNATVNKQWTVPVSAFTFTFTLTFKMGEPTAGKNVGVKWHFYNADGSENYLSESNAIDLLSSDSYQSHGSIDLYPQITGAVAADVAKIIGARAALTVSVTNNVGYDAAKDNKWNDYGSVTLKPEVNVRVLGINIPVWTRSWTHEWSTDNASAQAAVANALSDNLSASSILYTATSAGENEDLSYTDSRATWNGSTGEGIVARAFSFFSAAPASAEAVKETVVQKSFLADSDISVQDLGNGCYLAAFLDVVPGRDDVNKMGAYWSYYDGSSWSTPQLLDDDGTEDQLPVICEAGDAGYLVTWSSANKKLTEKMDVTERLNTLDLYGSFFKDGKMGKAQAITKTSGEDNVADTDPHAAVVKKDDGSTFLKLYYTKSEYSVSDAKASADGATEGDELLGDVLNPYQVIASRTYDFKAGTWVEGYSAKLEQTIKAGFGTTDEAEITKKWEEYQKNWYGQEFLDLAPTLQVSEQLDDEGYWQEGTKASVTPVDMSKSMVKEGDAIAYNGLSLFAYTLDKGGNANDSYDWSTTYDQSLYMQIYNAQDDEYHHPILLSDGDAQIEDVQFLRTTVPAGEDATEGKEVTWVYWKEQKATYDEKGNLTGTTTQIKRLNVTSLVAGNDGKNLEQKTAANGQSYYLINKENPGDGDGFEPAEVVVNTTSKAEGTKTFVNINDFQVKSDASGRYNYVVWTQYTPVETEDGTKQEAQLFVIREDTRTGETSQAIQVTDTADQVIDTFDFAVTENGNLDVLAGREFLKVDDSAEAKKVDTTVYTADPTTSELAFMQITPSDKFTIGDVETGDVVDSEDGNKVELATELSNDSFSAANDLVVEALDASGKTVWTSKETLNTSEVNEVETEDGGVTLVENAMQTTIDSFNMVGGEKRELSLTVPVAADGAYKVKLQVKSGDTVIATKDVEGTAKRDLNVEDLSATVAERNVVNLSTKIANDNLLTSGEHTATYGYIDADGNQVKLGTKKIDALKNGESTDIDVDVDINFSTFESKEDENGITDSKQFYLTVDDDSKSIVFGTVELTATAEQVALMKGLGTLSGKAATYNDDGTLSALESVEPGSSAFAALTVNDELAQNNDEYTNGLKVVWDAQDNSVATVTSEGAVTAKADGTLKLTGKVMPIDTEALLIENGASVDVDNYDTLPVSLIKTVEATITVGKGGKTPAEPTDPGTTGKDPSKDPNKGGSKATGKVPQLGDNVIFTVVVMAVVGTGMVSYGVYNERKNRKESK